MFIFIDYKKGHKWWVAIAPYLYIGAYVIQLVIFPLLCVGFQIYILIINPHFNNGFELEVWLWAYTIQQICILLTYTLFFHKKLISPILTFIRL